MNNTFDIKRFGRYALLNYWYHMRQYFGAIAVVVLILLAGLCKFDFTFYSTTWESDTLPIDRVMDTFTMGFYLVVPIFIIFIIRISMMGINGQSLTMHDMLIPISTFERYIFAILNSTIVAGVAYVIIFQVVSSFAESLYLLGDNGYLFKGFIGYDEAKSIRDGFVQECHFSLKEIITNGFHTDAPVEVVVNAAIVMYTLFISAFMWGEITFQNRWAVILTILSHVVILGVLVMVLSTLMEYKTSYPTGAVHIAYNTDHLLDRYCISLSFLFYLFPAAYQWVVWKKLRTISLTK